MKMPCRACRTCPGLTMREIWGEGWRPQPDGTWRKQLSEEEGRELVKAISRYESNARMEVITDTRGTRYYRLMGEAS